MRGWLIYSYFEAMRNNGYIEIYKEEGNKLGVHIEVLVIEKISFGVKNNELYFEYDNCEIELPDFVICRIMYPLLSKHLENMGVSVFNSSMVSEICNDKAKTYQYVSDLKIKIIDSEFVKRDFIYGKLKNVELPKVIKTVDGHGGKQVFLASSRHDIDEIYVECKDRDIVIQPLLGKRYEDLRVYIIGNKIIASVLRRANDGFKSNFSLGGEVSLYYLSANEEKLVNDILNIFKFDMAGIDFIIDDNGQLVFNEIEDVVGARMLYQCSEINIAMLYLNYIVKKLT